MQATIQIKNLETECIIGINENERLQKQKLLISIDLLIDAQKAIEGDDIKHTVDYKKLTEEIFSQIPKTHFFLLESLADFIADLCIKYPHAVSVSVEISKPNVIPNTEKISVHLTKLNEEKY